MTSKLGTPRRRACGINSSSLFGALLLLTVTGCSLSTDLGRPEKARVKLEGPPAASMLMVTSTSFLVTEEGNVSFVTADTTEIFPPFEESYDLGVPARLYFKAVNSAAESQDFSLKVWVGGQSWYNESKVLAPEEAFEFIYRYNEPAIF